MKAVIPAAGLGTRFLPYTKSTPKEMLPILDKPAIQYVVEEAVASGYDDILLVTGRTKRSIEDHFDRSAELEDLLRDRGNQAELKRVQSVSNLANMVFVRQKDPRGLGHAVLAGERYLEGETFGLLLGDDICMSSEPCQKQVHSIYSKVGATVLAVQEVPRSKVARYGIVAGKDEGGGVFKVEGVEEKPSPAAAKSTLAIVGRYHFTPAVLLALREEEKRNPRDVGLTPAIEKLLKHEDVYALRFVGRRYDVGDKASWLLANLELGLDSPEFRAEIVERYPEVKPKR